MNPSTEIFSTKCEELIQQLASMPEGNFPGTQVSEKMPPITDQSIDAQLKRLQPETEQVKFPEDALSIMKSMLDLRYRFAEWVLKVYNSIDIKNGELDPSSPLFKDVEKLWQGYYRALNALPPRVVVNDGNGGQMAGEAFREKAPIMTALCSLKTAICEVEPIVLLAIKHNQ